MASRLPALFTTAIVALAGCGGGADENEASAWSGIRDCLVESGIREFDEIPPTGPYMPPEVMPVNFGDAPGGWLIAHMNAIKSWQSSSTTAPPRQNTPRTRRPTSRMPWRSVRGAAFYTASVRRRHLNRSTSLSIALRFRPASDAVVSETGLRLPPEQPSDDGAEELARRAAAVVECGGRHV